MPRSKHVKIALYVELERAWLYRDEGDNCGRKMRKQARKESDQKECPEAPTVSKIRSRSLQNQSACPSAIFVLSVET